MDFFQDAWITVKSWLFSDKNDVVPTEQTVAPFNIHPLQFDITIKPDEEGPLLIGFNLDQVDSKPPPDINNIINSLLNSLDDATTKTVSASPSEDHPLRRVTQMNLPDKTGHTFIRVFEDATGQTVEILQESITDLPTTAQTVGKGIINVLNGTDPGIESKKRTEDGTNFLNLYIIAVLVLIIVLAISVGSFLWCKKNRLKAEKRNQYPIIAVVNNEYMDPQMLKNDDKLRSLP